MVVLVGSKSRSKHFQGILKGFMMIRVGKVVAVWLG